MTHLPTPLKITSLEKADATASASPEGPMQSISWSTYPRGLTPPYPQHLCCPAPRKTVTNWDTPETCPRLLSGLELYTSFYTHHHPKHLDTWWGSQPLGRKHFVTFSCYEIPRCITHHIPPALYLCSPWQCWLEGLLITCIYTDSSLHQAGKDNCLT